MLAKKPISTIAVIFVIALNLHTLQIDYWVLVKIFDYVYPPITSLDKSAQIIAEEAQLDTSKLIELYGYPVENHTVLTKDGYFLKLHRIPFGKKNKIIGNRTPVLMQHGVSCSSSMWVNAKEDSLGFLLAEKGYDVWLGNFRGNRYSRNHLTLKNTDKKYWHFGWDKLAKYDTPATIDYIRFKTGHDRVLIVGHSMGTSTVFAGIAMQPELNQKIKGLAALAPVVNTKYMPSMARVFHKTIRFLSVVKYFFDKALLPYSKGRDEVMVRLGTSPQSRIFYFLVASLCGYNSEFKNQTRIPIYALHYLSSVSMHIIYHWTETVDLEYGMRGYDYGREQNMIEYGQAFPKSFNVSNVKVPVGLMYAANDALATAIDVALMARKFPNVIDKYLLPGVTESHLDFVHDMSRNVVNLKVVDWLHRMDKM